MSFLDEILEHGGRFIAERSDRSATFRPVSDRDNDLESFQSAVRRLREHEGDGYTICEDHVSSDHGRQQIDLIVVSINAGPTSNGRYSDDDV